MTNATTRDAFDAAFSDLAAARDAYDRARATAFDAAFDAANAAYNKALAE